MPNIYLISITKSNLHTLTTLYAFIFSLYVTPGHQNIGSHRDTMGPGTDERERDRGMKIIGPYNPLQSAH